MCEVRYRQYLVHTHIYIVCKTIINQPKSPYIGGASMFTIPTWVVDDIILPSLLYNIIYIRINVNPGLINPKRLFNWGRAI